MRLYLQPITQREAKTFIRRHHRHHRPPRGWLLGTAINDGVRVVGVGMLGRPVARHQQDGYTAEVTRVAVLDGIPNGCSKLLGALCRAARAIGYKRVISYTLASEPGTSYRAAGFTEVWKTSGGEWSREGRPRVDDHPTEQKTLWERRVM